MKSAVFRLSSRIERHSSLGRPRSRGSSWVARHFRRHSRRCRCTHSPSSNIPRWCTSIRPGGTSASLNNKQSTFVITRIHLHRHCVRLSVHFHSPLSSLYWSSVVTLSLAFVYIATTTTTTVIITTNLQQFLSSVPSPQWSTPSQRKSIGMHFPLSHCTLWRPLQSPGRAAEHVGYSLTRGSKDTEGLTH